MWASCVPMNWHDCDQLVTCHSYSFYFAAALWMEWMPPPVAVLRCHSESAIASLTEGSVIMNCRTIGLDLAKQVFQVNAVDGHGNVELHLASCWRGTCLRSRSGPKYTISIRLHLKACLPRALARSGRVPRALDLQVLAACSRRSHGGGPPYAETDARAGCRNASSCAATTA